MVDTVQKSIRERAVSASDVVETVNKEIAPTVREIRSRLNELIPQVHLTPTAIQTSSPYDASFEELVLYDPATLGLINLPAATSADVGRRVVVKNTTGDLSNADVASADLVDGGSVYSLSGAYITQTFVWSGSTWWAI
jgi:hypothetical protein